ncbi:MAG: mandelate racemase/muconate lactonizing enzyme family protein [Nitrososphaerales archaeon]|jgi:L-alanine-DL-glutamate epimerase-like enolase superfamily enzyme
MKVTDVRTTTIEGNFDWILVKVYTDEGISGLGEIYAGTIGGAMAGLMKPFLLGEDPLDVDRLYWKLYSAFLRESGASALAAISGIETALWDIAGKALRVPAYRLLGGKYRDEVRVYADCAAGESDEEGGAEEEIHLGPVVLKGVHTPEAYAAKARRVKGQGYDAIKFDLDLPARLRPDPYNRCMSNEDLAYRVRLVDAVRAAVGGNLDLAFDCHWQYSVKDAIRLADKLEPYDLLWLEDPISSENASAMAKVSRRSPVPICTGEHKVGRQGFRELVEKQAADILSPDVQKAGGILETKKIADYTDQYYIPLAPHNIASPVGTVAAVHMSASIPNFLALEFHANDIPWWGKLLRPEGRPVVKQGRIALPSGPGLGIELDDAEVRKHLKKGSRPLP